MADLSRNLERGELNQPGGVGEGGGGVVGEGGERAAEAETACPRVGEAELEGGRGLLCNGARGRDRQPR